MRPSSRLSLNPDVIYDDPRARQRARWLFSFASNDVRSSDEFGKMPAGKATWENAPVYLAAEDVFEVGPFPKRRQVAFEDDETLKKRFPRQVKSEAPTASEKNEILRRDQVLRLVAEVADSYPRLLAWLTEGRVSSYWNVFGTLISLAQVIPVARNVIWRLIFEPVAWHAPWRFALRDVILQAIRYEINEILGERAGLELTTRIYDAQGLSAVTDVSMIAPTSACDDLRKRVENMSSGCIGVSGLPGSGKTTLIRDFCRHRYGSPVWKAIGTKQNELPGLRFTVQAPLRYHPLDFLVYQYTSLCEAVLADQRLNPASFLHRVVISILVPRSIRIAALLRVLAGVALAGLAAVLFYRAVSHSWPLLAWLKQYWEWPGGAAVCLTVLVIATAPTRRALAEVRQIVNLSTDAQNRLERLHYQRTDTHGATGTIGGPPGTNVNLSSTHALTEQMMTLPELVDDYRDFAERVVAALQQAIRRDPSWRRWHAPDRGIKAAGNDDTARKGMDPEASNIDVRLVIGIDEMDRIEDIQKADEFLAELNSIFGTPHCVYLISVSPGALATSDQQLVPAKTVSSGIFDDMVWVDPLDLFTAGHLLDGRVIGLPLAFTALCYVLSGGLPRDLLRIARNILLADSHDARPGPALAGATTRPSRPGIALADVTARLISDELRTLTHRTLANVAPLQVPAAGDLLRQLNPDHWPRVQAGDSGVSSRHLDIEAVIETIGGLWAGSSRARFEGTDGTVAPLTAEVCDSYLASLYFLRTVCHLFTSDPHPQDGKHLVTKLAAAEIEEDEKIRRKGTCEFGDRQGDKGILRSLARARIALGVNPYMAAGLVDEAIKDLPSFSGLLDLRPACPLSFLNPGTGPNWAAILASSTSAGALSRAMRPNKG